VNAHATATREGDAVEVAALVAALGARAGEVADAERDEADSLLHVS